MCNFAQRDIRSAKYLSPFVAEHLMYPCRIVSWIRSINSSITVNLLRSNNLYVLLSHRHRSFQMTSATNDRPWPPPVARYVWSLVDGSLLVFPRDESRSEDEAYRHGHFSARHSRISRVLVICAIRKIRRVPARLAAVFPRRRKQVPVNCTAYSRRSPHRSWTSGYPPCTTFVRRSYRIASEWAARRLINAVSN